LVQRILKEWPDIVMGMLDFHSGTGAVTLAERAAPPPVPRSAGQDEPAPFAGRLLVRRLFSSALLVAVAGSFVMAVALFLDNGGASQFDNLADTLVSAGILAALTATNALLMMLLLAARVPVVDRVLGQARATSLHAKLGEWVVLGLIVHATFVLVGYIMLDGVGIFAEFSYLWGESTDFVLAVIATGALFAVAASSFAVARRHLPYEAWHAVHLLSYATVGLAIPHMFSMSGLLAAGSWRRTYWVLLLVLTGAALVWFRFLTPAVSSLRFQVRVQRVVRLDADTFNIELTGRHLDRMRAEPGQFFRWRFLTRRTWWQDHPFSLSAAVTPTSMRVTVRAPGRGTQVLADLPPGTRVAVEGPYGAFTHDRRTRRSVVLVGAGAGIAPIRSLLEHADVTPGAATVVLRDSNLGRIPLLDEVQNLCGRLDARLIVLTGHRAGNRWVPETDPGSTLGDLVPTVADSDVYVCGPAGFVDSVVADARAAHVPAGQIHHEQFAW